MRNRKPKNAFYLINSIGKSIMVKYSTHYDYTHWARILITKFIFIMDIIIIYINLNDKLINSFFFQNFGKIISIVVILIKMVNPV